MITLIILSLIGLILSWGLYSKDGMMITGSILLCMLIVRFAP